MGTIPPVLHTSARAISRAEFAEALRAICPPRFPLARGTMGRPVGLAVSGGVDSMALAWLCYSVKCWNPVFKIADNPVRYFYAITIDHGLRPESNKEALAVADFLRSRMPGMRAEVNKINWADELGEGVHPRDLTNLESAARRMRFRTLGASCGKKGISSLLLAHHEDDQHETVMMRLLQGHGPAGLRGMRAAGDIPECHDVFGAYGSGFVDDQRSGSPFWNLRPSKAQKNSLRFQLRQEVPAGLLARELNAGRAVDHDRYLYDEHDKQLKGTRWLTPLAPLDVEDGGVFVYRPLLEFGKDRLVATCLENDIPWWEDSTNQDQTLTLRNAVRHISRNCGLPAALQKPSLLQLAKRCDARAKAQEAEADRLFSRAVVRDFEPNVGTVMVRLPRLTARPRRTAGGRPPTFRDELRRSHLRLVAALFVRKILALATPEHQLTPAANLQAVVSRLFPLLATDAYPAERPQKAFNICGVHLLPVRTAERGPVYWYLSREPYTSSAPAPAVPVKPYREKWRKRTETWSLVRFCPWRLWDGRFWVRVVNRLPIEVRVAPFAKEHAKPFREALSEDNERDRLAALLKRHAPGKVRYTLPALYIATDKDWVVHAQSYWRPPQHVRRPREGDDAKEAAEAPGQDEAKDEKELDAGELDGAGEAKALTWKLVALPTLGIHVPGIEHWLHWEVRYRRVDRRTFEHSARSEDEVDWRRRVRRAARAALLAAYGRPRKLRARGSMSRARRAGG